MTGRCLRCEQAYQKDWEGAPHMCLPCLRLVIRGKIESGELPRDRQA
jgi:hypothetical protein